jgi:hypothetical protein
LWKIWFVACFFCNGVIMHVVNVLTDTHKLSLSLSHTHTLCWVFNSRRNRVKKQSQVGLLLLLNSFVKKKEFVCGFWRKWVFHVCEWVGVVAFKVSYSLPIFGFSVLSGVCQKKKTWVLFWAFDFLRVKESSSV